ncbi:MAG TPA: LiaF domain-containing protein [Kofleriaceae bacterium]|nr:LiaF domain-containing protein [Kofleriaceae bacterium]
MSEDERKPALVGLRQRRQEVIDRLTDDFARDLIEVEEFEERVDLAHQASTMEALEKVVADLAPLEKDAAPLDAGRALELHPRRGSAALTATNRAQSRWAVAVMGGVERKGGWRVPERLKVVCMMGGAEIDFREVALPPGVTHVKVFCVMGGAEIIVPPDLAVECDGVAIMGGFEQLERAPVSADPDAPLLRVSGFAFMGGFTISTRLPGESARQASKRQRRERRELEQRERRELASGK